MRRNKILAVFAVMMGSVFSLNAQLGTVQTENGKVSGTTEGDVAVFKGIPFAAPPVGPLRWKAPQPAATWTGTKVCDKFSASPYQPKPVPFMCWTVEFIAPPEPLSEDCLYLNVWSGAKSAKEKRPVIVWIYGGGFSSGSAACDIYNGQGMADKGVVFVSINYRVGPFGFLALPELSKESAHQTSGNYGLLDQLTALKWVKKNIAAFGGDPDNVTIAGQSAGSMSVQSLVASSLGKGLFQRAIAESGGFFGRFLSKKLSDAEQDGEKFMQNAKAANLAELRNKSAEEILKASQGGNGMPRFSPVFDGYVLPVDVESWFAQDKQNDIPIISGWVTGDGALMQSKPVAPEEFKKQIQEKYSTRADEFLKIFPANTPEEVKAAQSKLALIQFAAIQGHEWSGFNKHPVYVYQFAHVPPDKPDFPNYGAFHTSEVPYALHTLKLWMRPWKQEDRDLEEIISSYWVNFAKNGNPNGPGLPEWKPYQKSSGDVMEFSTGATLKPGLIKPELDIVSATLNK